MGAGFLNHINISITASYIAIAVILFRFLLKKAPKAYTCILWLLVALRLIPPVSDGSKFSFTSIFSLIPSTEILPNTLIDSSSPQFNINVGIDKIDMRVNRYLDSIYTEGTTIPANAGSSLMNILGLIWIIVFIAIILYAIGSYINFRRKTKASIYVKENIFTCDYISTPFILGIIKPKILLPSTLSEEESRYVLAHERAHLKRLDYLWKPLGFILLASHWFNPIMWVSYILFCRDIELACDEYVIKTMNSNDKKAYSTALLNCSIPKKLISAYPLAFGEIGVKERIKAVLKYKKPAVLTSIIAVILCIITALCFLANPQKISLKETLSEDTINHIYSIRLDDGKALTFTDNGDDIDNLLSNFNEITTGKSPILDRNFKEGNKSITIYHYYDYDDMDINTDTDEYPETSTITFNFNEECNRVWIDNSIKPSQLYRVDQPDKVLALFESFTNSESENYENYIYRDNEQEFIPPSLTLYKNSKSFHFLFSMFSSTFCVGNYEITKDNSIICTTDEGNVYSFKKVENGLIFDAEHSTELPKYKYSGDAETAESPVPDGAFFEFTNG